MLTKTIKSYFCLVLTIFFPCKFPFISLFSDVLVYNLQHFLIAVNLWAIVGKQWLTTWSPLSTLWEDCVPIQSTCLWWELSTHKVWVIPALCQILSEHKVRVIIMAYMLELKLKKKRNWKLTIRFVHFMLSLWLKESWIQLN